MSEFLHNWRPDIRVWFWLFTAGVSCAVLFALRSPHTTPLNAAIALAALAVSLTPTVIYMMREDRPPMPFLALSGLFYAVFFALPVFFFDPGQWQSATAEYGGRFGIEIDSLNIEAQVLTLVGVSLMIASYFALQSPLKRNLPHFRLPKVYSDGRLRLLLWGLLVGHFAWHFSPQVQSLPSIGQFLQPVGPLAVGMLLMLTIQRRLPWRETLVLLLAVIPISVIRMLASGLLTEFVLFFGFLVVVLYYGGLRKIWLAGSLMILVLIALYPALAEFRVRTWDERSSDLGIFERTALLVGIADRVWLGDQDTNAQTKLNALSRRISRIVLFSYVVEKSPEEVSFLGGESYAPLITSFIPRVVWPGKPEERFGQTFGHHYRIIQPQDRMTSVNTPWIIEAYANFGRWGVILGMTVIGALLAFLSAIFNRAEMTSLEFVVGAAIIFPLAYPASNLSVMTGSLLPLALSLWLYFRFGLTLFPSHPIERKP